MFTSAETYEKCLETVREQFRIMERMSTGNRASWLQEVEHLLNQAKAALYDYEIINDEY
jgi:hypothetical protein